MARQERGLPQTFALSVPDVATSRTPVQLDDFLEREIGSPRAGDSAALPRNEKATPDSIVQAPKVAASLVHSSPPPASDARRAPTFPQRFRMRPAPVRAPRVQINMTPEVQRTVQELVSHFCSYGPQKDASASEVFEALVGALHEAREHLDLSNVPPRGQWGTPTARAFRINLQNAVIAAVGKHWQRPTGRN